MVCGDGWGLDWVDMCDRITRDTSPWYHDSSARRSLLNWLKICQEALSSSSEWPGPHSTRAPRVFLVSARHVTCLLGPVRRGLIFRPGAGRLTAQGRGGRWALAMAGQLFIFHQVNRYSEMSCHQTECEWENLFLTRDFKLSLVNWMAVSPLAAV